MGSAQNQIENILTNIINTRIDAISSTFSGFEENDLSQTFRIIFDMILKIVGAILVFHN